MLFGDLHCDERKKSNVSAYKESILDPGKKTVPQCQL